MRKLFIVLGIFLASLSAGTVSARLVDFYAERGQSLPSVQERQKDALSCGISNYSGTLEQNIVLESCLRDKDGLLGGTLPVAGVTYTLAGSGITAAASSITLQSLTLPQTGYELQDSDFSTTFYITLEPGNTKRQEIASCTTVTQNANNTATLSGCSRGLLPYSPYTASSSYAFSHAGGTAVIFSDPPQLFNEYPAKSNSELITGQWQFAQLPTSTTSTPTDPAQLITLYQFQQATTTGGVNASEAVKGVSELSTGAEAFAGTSLGSTGARLTLPASMATGTPTGGIAVPITSSTGKLAQGFLNLAEGFTFTGGVTSTGNLIVTGTTTMATSTMTSSTITQLNLPGKNVNNLITNLLFSTTTAGSINFSTASTTLVTTTVQAGTLDTGNVIQIALHVTRFGLAVGTPCYWNLRYGSQTFDVQYDNNNNAFNTNIDGGTAYPISSTSGWMYINLMTNGTTSTASADFFHMFSSSTAAGITHPFQPKLEKTTALKTINQTIDQSLVLTARMNNSSAAETLVVEKAWARVLR